MGLKSNLIYPFARKITRKQRKFARDAREYQRQTFLSLIRQAKTTKFGSEHRFGNIRNHTDFIRAVPVRDYESLRSYVDLVKSGENDVLWPGRPTYFAKTSGTTSGVKYIPLTKESTPHHVNTARNSLFNYLVESNNRSFFDGKMLYLSGSPVLQDTNGIHTGRLSGIVNHQIPGWIKGNKLPSTDVNVIKDWEVKVGAMVHESAHKDVRLIGGIPPWVQMYYEALLDYTGKSTVREVFPNLSVFVYGGVSYEPYRAKLEAMVGGTIDGIETFPASEGFFAYQDRFPSEGLLLNVNAGMFFEFIPVHEIHNDAPSRLTLDQVQTGTSYALVVSSNAGMWAYNIGDIVEFVSLEPPRLIVSGRIKHFISAFGEHVIAKEVEQAIKEASEKLALELIEFTVAPQVNPPVGLPYHEWFLEVENPVEINISNLEQTLDESLQTQNIYYNDLISGGVLRSAKVTLLRPHSFRAYMESIGKLGGQNKVPRLSNDRKIADFLSRYAINS